VLAVIVVIALLVLEAQVDNGHGAGVGLYVALAGGVAAIASGFIRTLAD
jgi:hypothetical protein